MGRATSPPFQWLVPDVPIGNYNFSARATDALGSIGISSNVAVSITLGLHQMVGHLSTNGQFEVCFMGQAGSNYVFEVATQIKPPMNWTPILTNQATANLLQFSVPDFLTAPQRYYRARRFKNHGLAFWPAAGLDSPSRPLVHS